VSISDPLVKRAVCQIDYPRSVKLITERGNLAHELMKKWKLNEFGTAAQDETIALRNLAFKQWVYLGPRSSRIMVNDPGVFTNFESRADQTLKQICGELSIEKLARIGVRLIFLAEVQNYNFSELNSALINVFLNNQAISGLKLQNQSPCDMAIVLDYQVDNHSSHLSIGPLRKEEIVKRFDESETSVPEVSIMIDSDYFHKAGDTLLEPITIRKVLKESYAHSSNIAQEVIHVFRKNIDD